MIEKRIEIAKTESGKPLLNVAEPGPHAQWFFGGLKVQGLEVPFGVHVQVA